MNCTKIGELRCKNMRVFLISEIILTISEIILTISEIILAISEIILTISKIILTISEIIVTHCEWKLANSITFDEIVLCSNHAALSEAHM